MAIDLSGLRPAPGEKKPKKRVGRGPGSGTGKTAGRGHKGRLSRSGGNTPPGYEGGQMPLQRRVPKRGFRKPNRRRFDVINVEQLAAFPAGSTVGPDELRAKHLVSKGAQVKCLGDGTLEALQPGQTGVIVLDRAGVASLRCKPVFDTGDCAVERSGRLLKEPGFRLRRTEDVATAMRVEDRRLSLARMGVDQLHGHFRQRASRGDADFGLNFVGGKEPDIEFKPLLEERFVAACRRDHPLARKRRVSWTELGQFDYISVSKASGNRLLLDQALAHLEGRPQSIYETQHVTTTLGMVEAGLGISLDDFGKGYAGFAHLHSLPISKLKIDRSLIAQLSNAHDDSLIVASTITLAKRLSLRVVAEGVETRDQLIYLKLGGCDIAQGYHFSRPLAA